MIFFRFSTLVITLFAALVNLQLSQAAVIETAVLWDNPEVSVCFAAPKSTLIRAAENHLNFWADDEGAQLVDWTESNRQFFRNTIESSYSKETTGIHFKGWNLCTGEEPISTVYLFSFINLKSDAHAGSATLGENGREIEVNAADGSKTTRYEKRINPAIHSSVLIRSNENTQSLIYTLLHEFGHLAGLRHELVREDARNDENCTPDDKKIVGLEKAGAGAVLYSDYDPHSIMNYCYQSYLKSQGPQVLPVLSNLDRTALKEIMYPRRTNSP